MTLQELIDKYLGKQVEVAGSTNAKFQCVDLANAYIRDVLGFPIIEWTNAQDFPSKADKNLYDWIVSTPTNYPNKGDIVIWKSKDKIGHIAIAVDGSTASKAKTFDQNWSKPLYCTLESHTYTGTNYVIIGWLRPKIKPINNSDSDMTEEQKRILDFIGTRSEGDVREAFGVLGDMPKINKEIFDLKKSVDDLLDRIEQLEADAKANNDLILGYQSQLSSAKSTESKLQAELKSMSDEKNVWKNRYESKLDEIKKLDKMTAWQHIKYGISLLTVKK